MKRRKAPTRKENRAAPGSLGRLRILRHVERPHAEENRAAPRLISRPCLQAVGSPPCRRASTTTRGRSGYPSRTCSTIAPPGTSASPTAAASSGSGSARRSTAATRSGRWSESRATGGKSSSRSSSTTAAGRSPLTGRADGVYRDADGRLAIEEIKSVRPNAEPSPGLLATTGARPLSTPGILSRSGANGAFAVADQSSNGHVEGNGFPAIRAELVLIEIRYRRDRATRSRARLERARKPASGSRSMPSSATMRRPGRTASGASSPRNGSSSRSTRRDPDSRRSQIGRVSP